MACVCVGIQITYFFFILCLQSCSTLSFFCAFDDDPFHCVCRYTYVFAYEAQIHQRSHPVQLREEERRKWKHINHTKSNLFRVFFFVEVIKSLLLLHIISWACAWTSMMSGEQRSLVLSICWWIFNKLSSALCGEQITIIIRWDLFRITRYFFFHF